MNSKSIVSSFKTQLLIGLFSPIFSIVLSQQAFAQVPPKPFAPALLLGNELSHFDFFYAGEAKQENMYMVRKGKIMWSYTHPVAR